MDQTIKVSIIIPIYKVEEYIVRCIDSVLRQTYRNLEIILVDDCSPDRSLDLAKEAIENSPMSKDLQFVYSKHDHNRGLSAARNTGMDAATGEYVYFLDSDDEITDDCIEALAKPLKHKKYDFVIGDVKVVGPDCWFFHLKDKEGAIIGNEIIAKSYVNRDWYPMAVNKLCHMDYLKANDMKFMEGLIHEDELWSFQLACTVQSMYIVKEPTYIYIIRDNSITSDANRKVRKASNFLKVLKAMYHYQVKHKLNSPIVQTLQNRFSRETYHLTLEAGYTIHDAYYSIRKTDTRSIKTKYQMLPSLKEKVLNFDIFMPYGMGLLYRRVLRKYFAIRNHDNNYPFWF